MDSPISEVNSFIVKTWTEFDEHGKEVKWHGHITHVPSGERRYLSKLDEVVPFIESFFT